MNTTRKDLALAAARVSRHTIPTCQRVLEVMLDVITESLSRGDSVKFRGIVTLSPAKRAGKMARNPRKNVPVWVPEHTNVKAVFGVLKQGIDNLPPHIVSYLGEPENYALRMEILNDMKAYKCRHKAKDDAR